MICNISDGEIIVIVSTDSIISVVIPVYNVEKYLCKCIDSVCASSYKQLEIILVDDGSEDASGAICDRYAEADNRVRVIHKTNGGLVSARKAGVEVATGKYITFVDGDDYIDVNLYKDVYDRINQYGDADLVAFNYSFVFEDTSLDNYGAEYINKRTNVRAIDVSEYDELINDDYEIKINNGVVIKFFITDILKKTIKRVGNGITKAEDLAITLTYLPECTKIILAEDICGYYYLQRESSMSHKYNTRSIEQTQSFIKCIMKYTQNTNLSDMWKKVIFNEGYGIIMSDCVNCCIKHYGKLRILSILRYFRNLDACEVIRDFYLNGVDSSYFSKPTRMKYAMAMAKRHYLLAFFYRLIKRY